MYSQEEEGSEVGPLFAVVEGWQQTAEARGYVNSLLKRNKRKSFGILERPLLDQHQNLYVLHRRLFLVGKAGVGKTSTVDKLCGRDISPNHDETLGIQTSTIYWPAKLVTPRRVVLVQLELWDVGERAMNKFDHILPSCKEATDGVVFFFSYTDRHSWEDLPYLISRTVGAHSNTLKLVVGTHADSNRREVTEADVEQFQLNRRPLIVLPIANVNGPRLAGDENIPDGRAGIAEITPFMNALTQILLAHEQLQSGSGVASTLSGLSPDTESPSQ